MKRTIKIAWLLASCALSHCTSSLNPQPFPPNSESPGAGTGTAADGGLGGPVGRDASAGNKSADAAAADATSDVAFNHAPDSAMDAPSEAAPVFGDAGDASTPEDSGDGGVADAPSETDAPELNEAAADSEGPDGEAGVDSEAGGD